MTVASIDIGSNTVLLLVALVSVDAFEIQNAFTIYRVPRVSEGVKQNGIINSTKEELLITTLEEYKSIIRQYNCEIVIPVATNAFRIAKNANHITDRIRKTFGWDVKIISGDEEARLTFLGSTSPFEEISSKAVIDIGGGSTEIIYGNKSSLEYKRSFPLGVVSLKEKYFKHDPPELDEVNSASSEIDQIIQPLTNLPNPEQILAVAGTPTTLACIKNNIKHYDDSLVDNEILTLEEIEIFRNSLLKMGSEKILHEFGDVVVGREDVLLAGTLILERIMLAMRTNQVTVSSKGLRYGVVYDYLMNFRNSLGKK